MTNINISMWTTPLPGPPDIVIILFSHTFQLILRRPAGPAGSFRYLLTRNAMCENTQPVGWNSWLNNRWRRLWVEICRVGQKTQMCFFCLCCVTQLYSTLIKLMWVSVSTEASTFSFFFFAAFCLFIFWSFFCVLLPGLFFPHAVSIPALITHLFTKSLLIGAKTDSGPPAAWSNSV